MASLDALAACCLGSRRTRAAASVGAAGAAASAASASTRSGAAGSARGTSAGRRPGSAPPAARRTASPCAAGCATNHMLCDSLTARPCDRARAPSQWLCSAAALYPGSSGLPADSKLKGPGLPAASRRFCCRCGPGCRRAAPFPAKGSLAVARTALLHCEMLGCKYGPPGHW